ncbi:MAG: hypothetical protein ACR2H0_02210, partial [Candidatus Limnocylindrales bacterium]
EPIGDPIEVWPHELAEVDSWRRHGGPTLGRDIDAGLTTLVTVKTDGGFGVAKILQVDRNTVHVRLYSDRWETPPDEIDPWSLRVGRFDEPIVGIGHMPLTRAAFAAWEPRFKRVSMLSPNELGGYGQWLESGGGVFG